MVSSTDGTKDDDEDNLQYEQVRVEEYEKESNAKTDSASKVKEGQN